MHAGYIRSVLGYVLYAFQLDGCFYSDLAHIWREEGWTRECGCFPRTISKPPVCGNSGGGDQTSKPDDSNGSSDTFEPPSPRKQVQRYSRLVFEKTVHLLQCVVMAVKKGFRVPKL